MSASAPTINDVTTADAARNTPMLRGKAAQEAPRAADARPDSTDTAKPPRRLRPKQIILGLVALIALGFAAQWGWHWWTNGRFEEATDDAFLQADKVTVAPKVGGFVAESLVTDNQPVKAGDVIARIDDRDYQVALAQDEADLDKSKASLEGVASALIQQQARIVEARADVANARASLDFAGQEATRYNDLYARGAGTTQRSQQATSDLAVKRAVLDKANASYDAAQKQIDALRSLEDAARATLRRSQINLEQAKLNLVLHDDQGADFGRRRRPRAAPRPARAGGIEPAHHRADGRGDLPRRQLQGDAGRPHGRGPGGELHDRRLRRPRLPRPHRDSFAPGTGSQFALLQPENATGNFTKIVQRVPVKIALEPGDPLIARLRPGLSAEAVIDTARRGASRNRRREAGGAMRRA